jgi:transposase
LDTLIPALGWGSEMIRTMARKNYSEEFRRQAVDLYESTPGATVRSIAADLGIVRGTLRQWLAAYGTGKKTAADGSPARSPLAARTAPVEAGREGESAQERIARLEAENAALRAEKTKLVTEREILQKAAKYFAGETIW